MVLANNIYKKERINDVVRKRHCDSNGPEGNNGNIQKEKCFSMRKCSGYRSKETQKEQHKKSRKY